MTEQEPDKTFFFLFFDLINFKMNQYHDYYWQILFSYFTLFTYSIIAIISEIIKKIKFTKHFNEIVKIINFELHNYIHVKKPHISIYNKIKKIVKKTDGVGVITCFSTLATVQNRYMLIYVFFKSCTERIYTFYMF